MPQRLLQLCTVEAMARALYAALPRLHRSQGLPPLHRPRWLDTGAGRSGRALLQRARHDGCRAAAPSQAAAPCRLQSQGQLTGQPAQQWQWNCSMLPALCCGTLRSCNRSLV